MAGGWSRKLDKKRHHSCVCSCPIHWGRLTSSFGSPGTPIETRIFVNPRVQTPEDWQEFKEHFRITPDGRYPEDWDRWAAHSRTASHPIVLNMGGFFGKLTNVLGLENETGLFMSLYDRPELVREIVEHFTRFVIDA